MLKLKNISKIYRTQERRFGFKGILKDLIKPNYTSVEALKNISIDINEGERIAIVGMWILAVERRKEQTLPLYGLYLHSISVVAVIL